MVSATLQEAPARKPPHIWAVMTLARLGKLPPIPCCARCGKPCEGTVVIDGLECFCSERCQRGLIA